MLFKKYNNYCNIISKCKILLLSFYTNQHLLSLRNKIRCTITNYYLRKYTIYYNFSPVHAFKLIFANCNLIKKRWSTITCVRVQKSWHVHWSIIIRVGQIAINARFYSCYKKLSSAIRELEGMYKRLGHTVKCL